MQILHQYLIRLYKNDNLVLKKQKGMRTLIITIIISCLAIASSYGQTYIKPKYERRANPRVSISKVQITKKYTVVHCRYTSTFSGHACVSPSMFIEDLKTKKRYKLVKTEKIPLCPKQYMFSEKGHKFDFVLYFERVPHTVRYINMIEDMANGFNFYRIFLRPLA